MNNKLFDGSDEDADDLNISTNQDYAKSYNILRKKELLQKYKDRGLDVSESELESDSESSDESDVDIKFDQNFFKTLASLKSKDPRIYDKETRFFHNADDSSDENDKDEDGQSKRKSNREKPVTLKDYERNVILKHNGKFESSDDENDIKDRPESPTAVEEERTLKAEFSNIMNQEEEGEDEEFGGIFKKRSKTKEQKDEDEADFAKWLAGKQTDISIETNAQKQLAPLKQYWSNSKLTQGESFLRDYILSNGYANTNSSEIPTYDEIVGENAPLSDDEEELEKQAEFEQKYNFRFEDPDTDFIKRYPRTIEQSIRRTDDKRKEKRKELKERKQQEKEQKMKELDLIKDMKRKDIEEKIRKLKAVTGNDELGFKDEELEDDFDPDAHDRRMQELFNEDYYNVDEGDEKPECPSDIEELAIEDWDNFDPRENVNDDAHCEDEDFNMDCDFDPVAAKQKLQQELIDSTRRGRKGRRSRFMEMIRAEKPIFNPEDEQTYGDYIDEYYKMDYEDIVGDQPCRFKYVETTPNDFGLTLEEILLAKNKELNQWASLKKAVQNRPDHVEKKEQRLYRMKAKNEDLKRKIFKSLYGEASDDEEQVKELKSPQQASVPEKPELEDVQQISSAGLSKSKRKRLKRKAAKGTTETTVPSTKPATSLQSLEAVKLKEDSTAPPKKCSTAKPMITQTPKGGDTLDNAFTPAKKQKIDKEDQRATNGNRNVNLENPFMKSPKLGKRQFGTNGNSFDKKNKQQKGPVQRSFSSNPFKKTSKNGDGRYEKGPRSGPRHEYKSKGKPNHSNPNGITDDRLKAYGINPRKFHNQKKYGRKEK